MGAVATEQHGNGEGRVEAIKPGVFGKEYAELLAQSDSGDVVARIKKLIPIDLGWRVLEAGCGYGRTVDALRDRGIDAIGIDINAWMMARLGNPYCTVGDVRGMRFETDSFDLVISIGVLEHLKEYRQAIAEMVRVSRNLVYVEVTTTAQEHNLYLDKTHCVFMSPEGWQAALALQTRVINEIDGNQFLLEVGERCAV